MSDPQEPTVGWETSDPTTAELPVTTDTPQPRRSTGRRVGAVAGVVALLAAGSFAVVSIAGNDDEGGAASPQDVGTQLTAALDNEDALGVIDLLLPGERDTFRDPLIRLVDNLRRLEVLSPEATLEDIGGLDIEFSDVSVRVEPTAADDISNIFLSGSSTVTVDGELVPLGSLLIDDVFDGDRPDMDVAPDSSEFDEMQLTVVERDGRWYLSAFYSLAEQARGETDQDIPTSGVQPAGAAEPELAVDALLDAVGDLDLEALIASLDPTEAEALQRYAPLFLDDAQQALDDTGITLSIGDRTYSVDGSGSRRAVSLDSVAVSGSVPDVGPDGDVEFSLAVTGSCVKGTMNGEEFDSCGFDAGSLDQVLGDAGLGDIESIKQLGETLNAAFEDYEPGGIAVHEVDGRWYVSPLRTGFDWLNDLLDALDRDEVTAVIDAFTALFEELTSELGGFGTEIATGGDYAGIDECYALDDAAEGVQCMLDGVADGTIDREMVNPPHLYPECGVAELYWTDVYSLSDAEFVAMAEEASPCFLDLVAAGEVDKYAVPPELLAPDCLEGMNWYASMDQDYSDRFFDCIAEARDSL